MHNLCVVYVERGKLTQALDCLQHAHKLAPQEDYILKHLKIVQQRLANLKQAPGMHQQKTIAFAKYDPKDFGGATTDTSGFTSGSNQREAIMMPSKGLETTTKATTTTTTTTTTATTTTTGNINKNGNGQSNSDTASTRRMENVVEHSTNAHAKTSSSPAAAAAAAAATEPTKSRPTIPKNQKLPDDSTISLENANKYTNKNSDQQINKNNRYRKQFIHDNSLPMFVHDMDDPSSGTS